MLSPLAQLLIDDVKLRLTEESIPRILKCLDMLTDKQVMHSFNDHTNSIANLIVHLEGNSSQWLLNTFAHAEFERNRKAEFEIEQSLSINELKERMIMLKTKILDCLSMITSVQLEANYTIQGFEVNGVSVLVHVTEHFSYHTGQIALIAKIFMNQATLFYNDSALNAFKK
jgi:uncharacterized damage-inducible protein DinB